MTKLTATYLTYHADTYHFEATSIPEAIKALGQMKMVSDGYFNPEEVSIEVETDDGERTYVPNPMRPDKVDPRFTIHPKVESEEAGDAETV